MIKYYSRDFKSISCVKNNSYFPVSALLTREVYVVTQSSLTSFFISKLMCELGPFI